MPGTKETDDVKNGKGVARVAESEEKAPLVIHGNGASNLMARSESLHRKVREGHFSREILPGYAHVMVLVWLKPR